ncbi:glutathione peroxidase 2-like [Branchiostoma lanceolatum]|uniref:Glutathione peroxidase n=1 Tax=Branchiostoma lanceolatum TaxID=7740 RepID=A0A8K0A5J0_BRALA|nr:GPX2 [Branchiostoma lanceolatum]
MMNGPHYGHGRVSHHSKHHATPHPIELNTPLCPASVVGSFFELSAEALGGEMINFSAYDGKVVLVVNVASASEHTTREYLQLNDLVATYGPKGLIVLGFCCNQFGTGEPFSNHEILRCLRAVRPGNRYSPNFQLFSKVDINGKHGHIVFEYLKLKLPFPSDNAATMAQEHLDIGWSPVRRTDVAGNFEKFLVASDGQPYRRYSWRTTPEDLCKDVEELLRKVARTNREQGNTGAKNDRPVLFNSKKYMQESMTRSTVRDDAAY